MVGTVDSSMLGNTNAALGAALAVVLADRFGADLQIESLGRLTGGASRETWAFDAVDRDGTRYPLILRRDFPGEGRPSLASLIGVHDDLDRRGEFALFEALVRRRFAGTTPGCVPRWPSRAAGLLRDGAGRR